MGRYSFLNRNTLSAKRIQTIKIKNGVNPQILYPPFDLNRNCLDPAYVRHRFSRYGRFSFSDNSVSWIMVCKYCSNVVEMRVTMLEKDGVVTPVKTFNTVGFMENEVLNEIEQYGELKSAKIDGKTP